QGAAGAGQRRHGSGEAPGAGLPRPRRQRRQDRPAQRLARPPARDHGRAGTGDAADLAMADAADHKILLVVRPTRLGDLITPITRSNTAQTAHFYAEHLGADFAGYLAEHERYREAVARAEAILHELGRVQRLERRYLPNFVFGPGDHVVVLGQDGLVANTLKY